MPRPRLLVVAALFAISACRAASSDFDGGDASALDVGPPPVWVVEPGIPTKMDLFAIWGRSLNDIFVVGWAGTILHYDGTTWSMETATSTVVFTAIHGLPQPDPTQPPGPV